jgi:hypothetical protein
LKSRIFIPQQPSRFDVDSGIWVPTHNIDAAKKYGDFIIMLHPAATRVAFAALVDVLKEKMVDYGPEDYLLALGDPSLIAAAAIIAYQRSGGLRLLKWDRKTFDYIEVSITV